MTIDGPMNIRSIKSDVHYTPGTDESRIVSSPAWNHMIIMDIRLNTEIVLARIGSVDNLSSK
jgi:hypothetical protein